MSSSLPPASRHRPVPRPPARSPARRTRRHLPPESLAHALLGAARACVAVRNGRALPDALGQVNADIDTHQARGAIQDLAYRTMRRRGAADAILARLTAGREIDPPLLRELLVVAIVLLLSVATTRAAAAGPAPAGEERAPYPAFTVVDQAVEVANFVPELMRAGGFVNGVLRNLLRDINVHRAMVADTDPAAAWNHPAWWVERVRRAWPDDWDRVLRVSDHQPPLTLRVNLARTHPDAMLQRLAAAGLTARRIGPGALRLDTPVPVERIPGFAEGLLSVQDEAAQRAAPLLDVDDGMRVLDACAAPGGKSGHLLEIADIDLTALDIDATRLERVRANLERLGVMNDARVHLIRGNAAAPDGWWDGKPFDRILADVPCTASGIVRRHPDIRWLRRDSDIEALAVTQREILEALWPLLASGGKFLYVTCSLFPEESARQAAAFGARHADAIALPAPGQLLPAALGDDDHDGLFFALFEKRA